MRRRIFCSLLTMLAFSSLAGAFPWHKPQALPYVPPYFGYYPNQWREFPATEMIIEKSAPVVVPIQEEKEKDKEKEKKRIDVLPEPKKATTISHPIVRGVNRGPDLPPLDPVPGSRIEQFRGPLATLGIPTPAK